MPNLGVSKKLEDSDGYILPHSRTWIQVKPIIVYMCASMWMEMSQLPCWLTGGQQVLHQRWIWGICCTPLTKHAGEGFHSGFETQIQPSPEVQIKGISGPTKGLMSSKNLEIVFFYQREMPIDPHANGNNDDGNTNTGIYDTKNVSFSDLFAGSLSL